MVDRPSMTQCQRDLVQKIFRTTYRQSLIIREKYCDQTISCIQFSNVLMKAAMASLMTDT